MKGIINLKKPIQIDGAEVKDLSYDTDKITIDMYLKANKKAVTTGGLGVSGASPQLDYSFQFYLGAYSIIAENPRYDITDIERVTGLDLMNIQAVGQLFTLGREPQMEEPSEEQSDNTPKRSSRTQSNSEASE